MNVGPLEYAVVEALAAIRRLSLAYADTPVMPVEERQEAFRVLALELQRLMLAIEHGNDYPQGSFGFVQ